MASIPSSLIQQRADEAKAALAQLRLRDFCERMNPRLKFKPYHDLIFSKLEALERGEIRNLVISTPPRHTKSTICSINLPAWILGRDPHAQIILSSYATDLARKNSRDARNLFYENTWPFKEAQVARDRSSAEEWSTSRGGICKAAGIGAGITGYGGDWVIIDDAFKGFEDALSKSERDKVWEWYVGEARTRLQTGGRTLVIGTRWHQDDLIGRILEEDKGIGEWEVLRLPAIAEENDPAGRKPGDPLDPERYPLEELEKHRRNSRTWNALFQQNPIPDSGNIFERSWWRYYDREELERAGLTAKNIYVDPAFGGHNGNDETAATIWGTLGGRFYLMDLWHKRVPYHELRKQLGMLQARWGVPLVIEENGWSSILVNDLRSPIPTEDGEPALQVIPYRLPGGNKSKVERAQSIKTATAESVTAMIEGGLVFLPTGAAWLEDFLEQMTIFPAGKHDDIVDSAVNALSHLSVERDESMSLYLQSVPVRRR